MWRSEPMGLPSLATSPHFHTLSHTPMKPQSKNGSGRKSGDPKRDPKEKGSYYKDTQPNDPEASARTRFLLVCLCVLQPLLSEGSMTASRQLQNLRVEVPTSRAGLSVCHFM